MAKDGGSYWVSALVGLIFMLFVSPFFPVAGPIAGGIVGGYLGPPGAVRGALGGLLDGLVVAAIFSVVAVVGGTAFLGPLGTLLGLGVAALLFALALYFGILGAVGGAIGGGAQGMDDRAPADHGMRLSIPSWRRSAIRHRYIQR